MKIEVLTLFPEMFKGPFDESIIKRAKDRGLVKISVHNLRNWADDKHKIVDDRPFGGGTGMVMKVDVIDKAVKSLKKKGGNLKTKVILLDAKGKKYTQKTALKYSKFDKLILICGHYEGVDHRVHDNIVDEVVSIGDYILTGGEIPAMILTDSVTRLITGVLEKEDATKYESFSLTPSDNKTKLLEYPQYTRPDKYLEWKVPKVLLSGDHKKIAKWRENQSVALTKNVRPDLIKKES